MSSAGRLPVDTLCSSSIVGQSQSCFLSVWDLLEPLGDSEPVRTFAYQHENKIDIKFRCSSEVFPLACPFRRMNHGAVTSAERPRRLTRTRSVGPQLPSNVPVVRLGRNSQLIIHGASRDLSVRTLRGLAVSAVAASGPKLGRRQVVRLLPLGCCLSQTRSGAGGSPERRRPDDRPCRPLLSPPTASGPSAKPGLTARTVGGQRSGVDG